MSKKYENVTVSIDEELGYISINDTLDEHIGLYKIIKNQEERDYLQNRYYDEALHTLCCIVCALMFPFFIWGIMDIKNLIISAHSLSPFWIAVSIIGYIVSTFFFVFFTFSVVSFAVNIFSLEQAIKEKKLGKFILAACFVFIVILIYLFMPSSERD